MNWSKVSDWDQKRDAISGNHDVVGGHQEQRGNDTWASAKWLRKIVDRYIELHNPEPVRPAHRHSGLPGRVGCVACDEPFRSFGVSLPHCIHVVLSVFDGGFQRGFELCNVSVLHSRTLQVVAS